MSKIKKPHYGWFVTIGCFIILMYSIGFAVNMNSILLTPLMNHIGISKSAGSSIVSVQNFVGLIFMMIAGKIYVNHSVRKFCMLFGLSIASGYLVFAFAKSLFACYAAAIMVGIGYGGSSMIPISILLTRWFHKRRGLALGVAALGTGFSAVVFSPIVAFFITSYGLPATYMFLFGVVVVSTSLAYNLIRDFPSDKGLMQYGMSSENSVILENPESDLHGDILLDALKKPKIYLIALAMFLVGMTLIPTITHMGSHLEAYGYSTFTVSSTLAVYGGVMLVFKPLYGMIMDRLGGFWSNYYIYTMWLLGLISALFIKDSILFVYMFAIFCGIGAPLGNMMPAYVVSEIFGVRNYTQIFTINKVLFTLGATIGSLIPGIIADKTGYYTGSFILFIIFVLIALIIFQSILYKARR